MLTALGGPGRLAFGALIGAAVAALLVAQGSMAKSPRGLEPTGGGGEIVIVKGSRQPDRTITATGTTSSSTSSSSGAGATSTSSATTTTTTTDTTATTTSDVTTTTTAR